MSGVAGLGFLAPGLLWGLLLLPVLVILLRVVPPAPVRRRFPGVVLLLGLEDDAATAHRTPWWLLLLRVLAVAALVVGFAGPVLDPEPAAGGAGALLVVVDGGWADAGDWEERIAHARGRVQEAGRAGMPVAVIRLTDRPGPVTFHGAAEADGALAVLHPQPFAPRDADEWAARLPDRAFDTIWLADGIAHDGAGALARELMTHGALTVVEGGAPVLALHPPRLADDGRMEIGITRLPAGDGPSTGGELVARGPDPAGIERELARQPLAPGDDGRITATLDLPTEIRNRITRLEIAGARSAGAVRLLDDRFQRRRVALVTTGATQEGLNLLSPLHFLREALFSRADIIEVPLADALAATPDAIILADPVQPNDEEAARLLTWVEEGGLLLRFAGPRLAARLDRDAGADPLLPVRLRRGGRVVGGTMSWDAPQSLAPFAEESPFFGLAVPEDVEIREQVLAEPDPDLGARTIAALDDGTPLVTRRAAGAGALVLVHVTANAEWSSLPLSGLFVDMLDRLLLSAGGSAAPEGPGDGIWAAETLLDARGEARDAGDTPGVPGARLAEALRDGPSAEVPPGIYAAGGRRLALNVVGDETRLAPAVWPAGVRVTGMVEAPARALKGPLLALAMALFLVDVLAALVAMGGLRLRRAAALLLPLLLLAPAPGEAADALDTAAEDFAIRATAGVVLAYVETGDPRVDEISRAGLAGLGDRLWQRTAIEPEEPMAVDIEHDDLALFPFLYWPVTADAAAPSDAARARLNLFLRTGGLILFDTRDGDDAGFGGTTPEGEALRRIARGLDIPPLDPLPEDHVLTRSFYLLQQFPGRQRGGTLWVEAAPTDEMLPDDAPFRHLNDGVTPVVIGANDWAAAWATDERGVALLPVGRGAAGDRQRELAWRFGINLVMHVLTGNYKSDQVHVPALLERLGQ